MTPPLSLSHSPQLSVHSPAWMEECAAPENTVSVLLASPVASASFHSNTRNRPRQRGETSSPSTQYPWSQTARNWWSAQASLLLSGRKHTQSSPYLFPKGTTHLKVSWGVRWTQTSNLQLNYTKNKTSVLLQLHLQKCQWCFHRPRKKKLNGSHYPLLYSINQRWSDAFTVLGKIKSVVVWSRLNPSFL